jgi:hypothetical protein
MVETARGMLYKNTPVEDYTDSLGLFVKREDLSCPKPGPAFSKTRGVYGHIEKLPHSVIGVLDTRHSQAGHAVARACQILGKECINFYPVYKAEIDKYDGEHDLRTPQISSYALGAKLHALPAARSCILFHKAKAETLKQGGYMMPNALKLEESIEETANEVMESYEFERVIIPISSGTIAAGVVRGFMRLNKRPTFVLHLGYDRSHDQVRRYVHDKSGFPNAQLVLVNEKYSYADVARPGPDAPFPCNQYYDLKALRWWLENRNSARTLFWNIG